ncbi:MAG: hypothetical protein IKE09_07380 [Clostridiales bacterium]|nr:hypothetical protein [Clostridiales bacterium]
MKRFKLSTIVLSTCLALSTLAGCSQGSAPAAGTMPDRATPHESDGVASEISAIIYDAEVPEDVAAEAPADEDSFSGNYTDSVGGEYVDPDADRQIYANAFVSAFAEQNISEMDTENLTVEEYLDFVRIYLKTHATDLISYEPKGEMLFETFTPASAHEVIKVFFGFFTSDVFGSGLEAPSEAHGDQPAGPFYEDGRFWYEACDTEDSNRFAIVDSYTVNEDGTVTLGFTVYEAGPNDSLYECYRLSPEEAAADSTINIVTNGSATVRINQSGEYSLIYYKTDI